MVIGMIGSHTTRQTTVGLDGLLKVLDLNRDMSESLPVLLNACIKPPTHRPTVDGIEAV